MGCTTISICSSGCPPCGDGSLVGLDTGLVRLLRQRKLQQYRSLARLPRAEHYRGTSMFSRATLVVTGGSMLSDDMQRRLLADNALRALIVGE